MKIGDENWEIGDRRGLNVSAYDAYVLACAINQRAPLLTLDGGLRERARELKLDVLEANLR